MTRPIADLRREYALASLDVTTVDPDPIVQFSRWFEQALASELLEPNAMTLATSAADGWPSARVVLLKEVDVRGFVFFTDYRSRKSAELVANPRAALVFLWKELERQVRIQGEVAEISREESDAYFQTRPRGSQLGAWASHQSTELPDRETLERAVDDVRARFGNGPVALPPHWGGYRLVPRELEFWQGRENRLHDRIRYRRGSEGQWTVARLSP
jgi:pyridoxamine 5'-phosphate oxidase